MSRTQNGAPVWQTYESGMHHRRIGTRHPGFDAFILRGPPGPTAVLNGGTHGDEYEGPTVLRQMLTVLDPRALRGTLILIPVLHEDAFFAGNRCHPQDGSNLARVFPGKPRGNNAERVADLFLRHVLRHADYYIDLHSGGTAYDLLPWSGYMITRDKRINDVQQSMALCFDDYWCWGSPYISGRTLSSAADERVPAIYIESSGGGGVTPADCAALHRGIRNFLIRFGFIAGALPRMRTPPVRLAKSSREAHLQLHHPAPANGLFIPAVALGATIAKHAVLGAVHPLDEATAIAVKAGRSGTVVSLRRQRSVMQGDALATVVELPAGRQTVRTLRNV
jgi:predicted deacylase